MYNDSENIIEWIKDESRATVSLSQRRTISKVKSLSERFPEECQIIAENNNGSICAHIPVSWIKIIPPRQMTEEQRKGISNRFNRI